MNSDWQTVTTEALIEAGALIIGDGYRAKNDEMAPSGLPFARAGNVDGGIHLDGVDILGPDGVRKAGEKVARAGDSVFTSKGTVGRFAYVNKSTRPFVYSPQLCYWRVLDGSMLEPLFLHYWLQGRESWEQLAVLKGQTDMADYVSLTDQRRMTITLPPIAEQRRIAGVLGAIDDKIEVLRRVDAALEDAEALAFRLLMTRNRSRCDRRALGELLTLEYGKALKAVDRQAGPVRVYGSKGQIGWHDAKLASGPGVVVGRKGNPGAVAWAPTDFFVIDTAFYAVPTGDVARLPFLFHALRSLDFAALNADSAVPGLNRNMAYQLELDVPPPSEIARFDEIATALRGLQTVNGSEAARLERVGDALLPRLVSGEIRVPEDYEPGDLKSAA